MCLVPLPADTASVDNPSTRTITLPGPSFLDSTTMKISIFRIPGCAHLTFQAIDGTGVPGRALPRQTKENTSDVEAALGTSHRLTGTAFGREPATLNGRRRGTKEFLGRGERSSQSKGTRSKFRSADPVDVFGAASRGHRKRRQSFDADNYVARSILPGLNNNEDFNLQNSGVRALDFPGHRCVRVRRQQPPAKNPARTPNL